MYIVLFGNDRYHADLHVKAARYKFDHLPDARKFAKKYSNVAIFKVYFDKESGDVIEVSRKY